MDASMAPTLGVLTRSICTMAPLSIAEYPSTMIDCQESIPLIPTKTVPRPRAVRSFVRRSGRVTTGQANAYAKLGKYYLLPFQQAQIDVEAIFFRKAPMVLEIGFGMGEATAHIAGLVPNVNFLCCEVHEPGVGALLKRIDERKLQNIRICMYDAVEVLAHMLPQDPCSIVKNWQQKQKLLLLLDFYRHRSPANPALKKKAPVA